MFRLPVSFVYCSRLCSITRGVRRCCTNFPKVQVISTDDDEFMKISFRYGSFPRACSINLKASKEQNIQEVLSQIKQIVTVQQKKEKIRQVVINKYSQVSSEIVQKLTENKEFEVDLLHKDRQLDYAARNIDAWTQGSMLKIGDSVFEVDYNTPKVIEISLPEFIISGCTFRPYLKFECATVEDSNFSWYRAVPNVGSYGENSQSEINNADSLEWQKVGEGFLYTVSPDDIGCRLKLVCTPKMADSCGPAVSSISKNAVEAGPQSFPFEERHLHTKELVDSDCIRCMTYNILANCYVETKRYPYCTRKARDISYRKQLLIRELLGYNSDIICLQEVQERVFEYDLLPILKKVDLDGFFVRKSKRRFEGLAIFYRTTKFRLVHQEGVHLSEIVKEKMIFHDLLMKVSGNYKDMSRLLAQSTALQVAILEHFHRPEHRILVANTHLYSNKDTPEVRLIQAALCTYYIEHLLKAEKIPNSTSLIFCGDFNSLPDSDAHKFIMNGSYECCSSWKNNSSIQDTDTTLRHRLSLQSACGSPRYTNYTEEFYGCLDYIFYSKDILDVTEVVPMPNDDEVTQQVALPNEFFPSDHLALVCTLKWKCWNDL